MAGIRTPTATTVPADPTYTFLSTDPPGTNWKVRVFARDGSTSIGASNGLIRIPGQPTSPLEQINFFNIDEQVFTLSAPPTITKLSTLISDPVTMTTNPRHIPGAIVEYTVLITNPGLAMTADSVNLADILNTNTALFVGSPLIVAGPLTFTQGTPSSGLTYNYTNPTTGDLRFFDSGGVPINTLTPNASGCDAAVARIQVNPKGVFTDGTATGPDPSFTLRFRVCVK